LAHDSSRCERCEPIRQGHTAPAQSRSGAGGHT
jgi:hypothetical protein